MYAVPISGVFLIFRKLLTGPASNGMKRWEIIVLVFAVLFFAFLFSRDSFARA